MRSSHHEWERKMSIIEMIRNAGIVGEGGAGFPTHVKVNCKAECVIANGAECEPLLRVDQQIMQYYPEQVVAGLMAVMKQTGAGRGVIALKDHYTEAIAALNQVVKDKPGIELYTMKSTYPAGDEQQIVYSVMNLVVPTGGLPRDVGAVVSNVSTLRDIGRAMQGNVVTDKYVTVGGAVTHPITVQVPIGTSGLELLKAAGGTTEKDCVFVIGGPCMGRISETADFPVTKVMGGILAIPRSHPLLAKKRPEINLQVMQAVCCQCSMCTQMCPRNSLGLGVEPHKAMRAVAYGKNLGIHMNGIFSCCDCGICTYYACNFGLKPSKVMQMLKKSMADAGIKPEKETSSGACPGIEYKKLPVSRLIDRLGIREYDVPAPMVQEILKVRKVCIPLHMHIGAPAVPVVQVGQKVNKGALIADIPEKGLGAKVHASISGIVRDISEDSITIAGGDVYEGAGDA